MLQRQLEKLKKATLSPPYLFYFLGISLAYLALNFYLNQTYLILSSVLTNIRNLPLILFMILISLLVAVNVNLIIIKFKELKPPKKETGLTFIATFGSLLVGACPGCLVGLFPAFLGIFGMTSTLSILPFYGLEIQIVSTFLLIISVYFLTKDTVCKIKLP